jgi:tetratricopeptide (TPR) repeat protein
MIRRIIYVTTLIVFCSCSTNLVNNLEFLNQRSPIAKSLEDKERYAEALTQWKILQIAYPKNEVVKDHIVRLEYIISNRVVQQLDILDKARAAADENLERNVYLKILALEPNNEIAIEELRKFEWKFAIQEASSKTDSIKKYFIESQEEAKTSIQLTKYIQQGEQLIHDKKYQELLQLADKFEDSYSTHLKPDDYRILACTKLGEVLQKNDNTKEAIEYYQQALGIAALKGDKLPSVRKKTNELSGLMANRYLKLANKVFQTNLDEAITYFEQSLKYQPNNVKTRQLMQRAIKIKQNLLKIKNLDSNSD